MPSSVFRCISVFQVYFGVYTDREARRTAPKDSLPQFRVRVWLGLG